MEARGRRVWEGACWSCHGSAGRGDGPAVERGAVPPPPNLQEGEYPTLSTEDLHARFEPVLAGRDTTHPHMKAVLSFMDRQGFEDALAFVPVLLRPTEVPGSALVGREIYEFRCSVCHGDGGRGDGSAAAQLSVRPADFTADTLLARGDWDGAFSRIREGAGEVHGSAMPPWGVIFDAGEIWNLVAYISTFSTAEPAGADRGP